MATFEELGVRSRTVEALKRRQIETPNAVQCDSIPELLNGRDIVLEAPTGSGKTLAFVVPMVERLSGPNGGPRALIVTPTRELAGQIAAVIKSVDPKLHVVLIIGGVGYGTQTSGLRNRPDVVVGCPGRILDLAQQGFLRMDRVEYLVLDEADEMFDTGFAHDVERIIGLCPTASSARQRQTVLASATMPDWVQRLIHKHLNDPVRVRVADAAGPALEHGILSVQRADKVKVLENLLNRQRTTEMPRTIVFHRTKHGAKALAKDLGRRGHLAVELQGNLSQNARDRAIGAFRSGNADVLVATNVAARGIDVTDVGLVVNYELPETAQWLTHRVGRTARNGAAGRAVTFLSEEDGDAWRKLRRLGAPALPEVDSTALLGEGEWLLRPLVERPATPGSRPAPRGRPSGGGGSTYGRSGAPRWRGRGRPAGQRTGA